MQRAEGRRAGGSGALVRAKAAAGGPVAAEWKHPRLPGGSAGLSGLRAVLAAPAADGRRRRAGCVALALPTAGFAIRDFRVAQHVAVEAATEDMPGDKIGGGRRVLNFFRGAFRGKKRARASRGGAVTLRAGPWRISSDALTPPETPDTPGAPGTPPRGTPPGANCTFYVDLSADSTRPSARLSAGGGGGGFEMGGAIESIPAAGDSAFAAAERVRRSSAGSVVGGSRRSSGGAGAGAGGRGSGSSGLRGGVLDAVDSAGVTSPGGRAWQRRSSLLAESWLWRTAQRGGVGATGVAVPGSPVDSPDGCRWAGSAADFGGRRSSGSSSSGGSCGGERSRSVPGAEVAPVAPGVRATSPSPSASPAVSVAVSVASASKTANIARDSTAANNCNGSTGAIGSEAAAPHVANVSSLWAQPPRGGRPTEKPIPAPRTPPARKPLRRGDPGCTPYASVAHRSPPTVSRVTRAVRRPAANDLAPLRIPPPAPEGWWPSANAAAEQLAPDSSPSTGSVSAQVLADRLSELLLSTPRDSGGSKSRRSSEASVQVEVGICRSFEASALPSPSVSPSRGSSQFAAVPVSRWRSVPSVAQLTTVPDAGASKVATPRVSQFSVESAEPFHSAADVTVAAEVDTEADAAILAETAATNAKNPFDEEEERELALFLRENPAGGVFFGPSSQERAIDVDGSAPAHANATRASGGAGGTNGAGAAEAAARPLAPAILPGSQREARTSGRPNKDDAGVTSSQLKWSAEPAMHAAIAAHRAKNPHPDMKLTQNILDLQHCLSLAAFSRSEGAKVFEQQEWRTAQFISLAMQFRKTYELVRERTHLAPVPEKWFNEIVALPEDQVEQQLHSYDVQQERLFVNFIEKQLKKWRKETCARWLKDSLTPAIETATRLKKSYRPWLLRFFC